MTSPHQPWFDRWAEGRIGFHQEHVHADLRAHAGRLLPSFPGRVLVPLCGKSLDLAWLAARGHHVIGVEIVPRAIEAFFAEHRLEPRREEHGGHPVWRAPGLEIHEADIFSLDPGVLPPADALWDRAALIALPAAERGPYASLMLRLLHETSPILLVSLEYDQHAMEGPPYSVPEAEIRTHFGAQRTIDLLESRDALDGNPRFREVGLRDVLEKVYLLR